MGLFSEMQDIGVVESYTIYEQDMVDYRGDSVKRLMVDIRFKGNIITLYSTYPFSKVKEEVESALDRTFLHTVKTREEQESNPPSKETRKLGGFFNNIFGKRKPITQEIIADVKYHERKNIVYTPEGIFCSPIGWEHDEYKYDRLRNLSAHSRRYGVDGKCKAMLHVCKAVKLIDFKK